MTAKLPKDGDSEIIQVLSPNTTGTAWIASVESPSTSTGIPAGSQIIRVATTGAIYVAFGVGTATATASASNTFFIPANGVEVFAVPYVNNVLCDKIATKSLAGAGSVAVSVTRLD